MPGDYPDWRITWYAISNWWQTKVRGGIREFEYDIDKPAFLKGELVRFCVDRYSRPEFMIAHVDQCPFWEDLTLISNVKSIMFHIQVLELVHQVGGFAVSESGDSIGQIGVWASGWLPHLHPSSIIHYCYLTNDCSPLSANKWKYGQELVSRPWLSLGSSVMALWGII